jgi:hypothetical protein
MAVNSSKNYEEEARKGWDYFLLNNPDWQKNTFKSIVNARDSFFNYIRYFIGIVDPSMYSDKRWLALREWLEESDK